MENIPKISIIIPTFIASKTLIVALDSIIQQSFTDFEVLIMDGLSTDNTLEIAKSYNDKRIKIYSEKDSGIYDAMNKGIQLAQGEWLYFLGSDDKLFNNETLKEIAPQLDSSCDVLYGNVIFSISGKVYDGKFTRLKLIQKNICHQAIFTRKSIFQIIGFFNTEYKGLADWHFNIKWFNSQTIRYKHVPQVIAYYNEDGYSFNNPDLIFKKHWKKNVKIYFPFKTRFIYVFINNRISRYIQQLFYHE